ncbi:hypothetical protein [Leptospira adleri]|uniref:EpsG family protein n=1 Tax=Leptospira adleri TaxID=2023186 RepID=A0A2M9YIA6_9LEPT|nr:hypothetical protein [Leptospira adleri]PJZ51279.1 hypothetical protein CH380_20815 [Leptospira adleri]PJZ60203.1 hypothetical protein CH376_19565 [Leptospira adleri]
MLLVIVFYFVLREGASYLYQSKEEARVYNTGFYWLSKSDLSPKHQSDSFLFPYLLFKLNADLTPAQFARLCNDIQIAATLLLVFTFAFEFGWLAGAFIGLFVLLSPLILIQKVWIGFSDHLTYFFSASTLILLDRVPKNRLWFGALFVVLLLGAWNHFYQFSIIVCMLVLIQCISEKKIEVRTIGLVLGTLLFARILSLLLFSLKGIPFEDSRFSTIKNESFSKWIEINTTVPHLALFSFFFGNLVFFLERLYRKKLLILIPFGISLLVTFFTYDTTRVFVHLFYPSWIFLWLLIFRSDAESWRKNLKYYFVLILISLIILVSVPRFFIEAGAVNYLLP